ncbi:hypothetical protein M3Y98_00931300 [Aphelenchoides besseyi]|nr:hypothetical protein M3Y98_00931300 [Aphelenchoides besseyi]
MLRSGSLLVRDCGFENVRYVSSKYIKPHPRSYKRRLFEAAVAPVLPPKIANCVSRLAQKEARKKRNGRVHAHRARAGQENTLVD